MNSGEPSGTKEDYDEVWAKLVPADSTYPKVDIRSQDAAVCSQAVYSSSEKVIWCEIRWSSVNGSASIRNMSSNTIIVNGRCIGEETVDIETGSQITSGPDAEGYLTYTFEVIQSQKREAKRAKVVVPMSLKLYRRRFSWVPLYFEKYDIYPCEKILLPLSGIGVFDGVQEGKHYNFYKYASHFHYHLSNGCFSEWLRRSTGAKGKRQNAICPQCREVVHSVGRNHFLHNIEEAILQASPSMARTDEEIASLDAYSSVKSSFVLGTRTNPTKKRPFMFIGGDEDVPCPQCGSEIGGFRCNRTTAHLQCHGCGGLMPLRPSIDVAQKCLGCDRAFCGAYWSSQMVDANEYNVICLPDTFKPILERTISRLPDSIHQNNQYEREVTEKCIQQTGKSLPTVLSDLIIKFNNKEIDRAMLQLSHVELITSRTYICNDCYGKFVDYLFYWFRVSLPSHLLPPDASQRENCWYGYLCRTQQHNEAHARKRNHVCRPTRGNP